MALHGIRKLASLLMTVRSFEVMTVYYGCLFSCLGLQIKGGTLRLPLGLRRKSAPGCAIGCAWVQWRSRLRSTETAALMYDEEVIACVRLIPFKSL